MHTFRDSAFYRYHCATKHTLVKLQNSAWYLDWDNQPDPFRNYSGCPQIELPRPEAPAPCSYFRPSAGSSPVEATIQLVSQLLYYSMAISACKETVDGRARWSLRVNPSSGNLHPTETHLVLCGVDGIADGVYHFRADTFALEARYQGNVEAVLRAVAEECRVPRRAIMVLLTSIFWREAWKYRERAFRYCHLDIGHAVGSIGYAARGLGLALVCSHLFDDGAVERVFGLESGDERPCAVLAIGPEREADGAVKSERVEFRGIANTLSSETIAYEPIDEVYEASRAFDSTDDADDLSGPSRSAVTTHEIAGRRVFDGELIELARECSHRDDLWDVVRRRRSGVDFDGQTSMSAAELGAVLLRASRGVAGGIGPCVSRRGQCTYFVHLVLYVHRVDAVDPGVYYYDRDRHGLLLRRPGDVRREAAYLSLTQSIAGDSAFAVSMVADVAGAFALMGERGYRSVHIEAGAIGQGLYLGAESVGLNATGIGAFFDDDTNAFLGLPDGVEVIYHFTVGRAVYDPRVRTEPAYPFEPI